MEAGWAKCRNDDCDREIGILVPEPGFITFNLCCLCNKVNVLCATQEDYSRSLEDEDDWISFALN